MVSEMELGTFGSILKYAIEIENEVIEFYRKASTTLNDKKTVELFNELANRGEKRIKTLERVRRENTTEMILEPIKDFDSNDYSVNTEIPEDVDDKIIQEVARSIESKLELFYNTASQKIDFLSEAAYAFELLAEKNTEAKKHLS